MKLITSHLLLLFFCQNIFAQVTGKVLTTDRQPIASANVLLLKTTDSSLVKASLTDEHGNYKIEPIVSGDYFLRVTSVGFKTWSSTTFTISDTVPGKNFGEQLIQKDAKQLGEVVVIAQRPPFQQKPEGIIVNVENSLMSKGSSVLDVLERSPGVLIDHYNNNFTLNGKSGAVVMIDGKIMRMSLEQLLSFLNGISANDIEKIELLTTPPPGYDAEGVAGIINIILKKNKKKGTNGSVSLMAGYGAGEKGAANVSLNHNTDKVGLYGAYSFSHNNTYSNFSGTGAEIVPALGGGVMFDFFSETRSVSNSNNINLGIDIKPNPTFTVGANINYNSSGASAISNNHGSYLFQLDSLLTFNGTINRRNNWKNMIASVYAEKKIGPGDKINFDADYLFYKNNDISNIQSATFNNFGDEIGIDSANQFSPIQQGLSNSVIRVGILKLDYTKQLGKKIKIETGVKGTYTSSDGESVIQSLSNGEWINREETSGNIHMNESIGAAYTNITAALTPTISLSAGARYEYYHTHANNAAIGKDSFDRKLGQIFPFLSFSKKINDQSEFQISYTRRISRPSYNDLASFVIYNDPLSVFTGNPFLKPTITNNLKFGYTFRAYALSLLFSRDDNTIVHGQLRPAASGKLVYILPENVTYQNNISLQATVPIKISNWWDMSYVFIGGWRQFRLDYTLEPAVKNYFGYSFNFSEQFKLPKHFSAEISGWYNGIAYFGTSQLNARGMLNAGIKKELKNNGGTLQLSISDILQTGYGDSYFSYFTEDPFHTKAHVHWNEESRKFPIMRLTYTRTFGGGTKNQRTENNGFMEENDRIRKN